MNDFDAKIYKQVKKYLEQKPDGPRIELIRRPPFNWKAVIMVLLAILIFLLIAA